MVQDVTHDVDREDAVTHKGEHASHDLENRRRLGRQGPSESQNAADQQGKARFERHREPDLGDQQSAKEGQELIQVHAMGFARVRDAPAGAGTAAPEEEVSRLTMGASDTGAGGSEAVDRDGLRNALKRNEKLAAELKSARSHLRLQKQETERVQKYLKQVMAEKQKLATKGGGAELEERIRVLERDLVETENDLTILEDKMAEDQAQHARDRAELEELRAALTARDERIAELEKGSGVDRARIAAQLEQVFTAEVAMLNARITELEEEENASLGRRVELEEALAQSEARIRELEAGGSSGEPSRVAQLEAQLFQREARIANLEEALERPEEDLERSAELESQLAQRDARIAKLEAVLAGRELPNADAELEAARARIRELEENGADARLVEQLAQRDLRITKLEAVLAGRELPAGDATDLKNALERIAQLEAGTRVAELEAALELRQKRISKLEAALMKRGGTLTGLDQTVLLEARVAELEKSLEGSVPAARLAELEASLAVQAEVQNTLLQDAVKREARIAELEKETSRNADRRDQLDGHTMAVSQLEAELRAERARLAKLQGDAQRWLVEEKAAREAEIEQLKRIIAQKAHSEKDLNETIASLRRQLQAVESRPAPGDAELQAALSQLAEVRAESQAALDREVARNDAVVAELDKQLRDQATSLKTLEAERQVVLERVTLREARVAELELAVKMAGMRIEELEQNLARRDKLLLELEQADRLTQSRASELEAVLEQRDIKIAGLEDQLRRANRELEQVDALAESFEAEMRAQIEDLQRQLAERETASATAFFESGASSWPDAP